MSYKETEINGDRQNKDRAQQKETKRQRQEIKNTPRKLLIFNVKLGNKNKEFTMILKNSLYKKMSICLMVYAEKTSVDLQS